MSVEKDRKDREAIVYMAAAIPFMMWRLALSYLRMRRQARREGHLFYQTLLRDGVPKEEAKKLAEVYVSSISLTSMIREMMPFTS